MMTETRQTREITIETYSITIVRVKGGPLSAHCERCQTTVAVFALEQIAPMFGLTVTEVCCRIEADELHLIERQHGVPLVCGDSLKRTD